MSFHGIHVLGLFVFFLISHPKTNGFSLSIWIVGVLGDYKTNSQKRHFHTHDRRNVHSSHSPHIPPPTTPPLDRLGGLVVKASASGAEDPGFESRLRRDFSGSSHTSDLKIGTPVTTLPGAWHYRVSAGTGRPGVSIL